MLLGSGIQDPGSGKNLFQIPDPGSRVKKAPDPQHCCNPQFFKRELVTTSSKGERNLQI
jgi:hypothetical protein